MAKFFFGVLIGIVLLALFFYFGGPGYLKSFGAKTEAAGGRLEKYEKQMKDTTKDAGKSVKETAEDAKKSVNKTYDRTKEKVNEYMHR
ncbi:MAG: YtxH domain-containing protein [Deltaproteobacteria bacterium]|nr:YtxH domain-containing protein [Deltaproteobacteria bacterium]